MKYHRINDTLHSTLYTLNSKLYTLKRALYIRKISVFFVIFANCCGTYRNSMKYD